MHQLRPDPAAALGQPAGGQELPRRLSAVAFWFGIATAAVGGSVLAGWVFDIRALKTIYGPITMKANAAIAFLFCGVSLARLAYRPGALGHLCAGFGGALGLATLIQHLTGWDLGIDQLLFTEADGAVATASPGRMGAHASSSFVCAAVALSLLHAGRRCGTAQALAFVGGGWALIALAGYVYGAYELYGIALYTGIALHTAVALLTLHLGILFARADQGPMAVFANEGTAGLLLRRLTPWVIALPVALGYGLVLARRAEIVDRGLGIALLTMAIIAVLLTMLWHTAAVIAVTERERARAQDAADRANRLKDQFIAVLSHELRTPLNVMLGRLPLLERAADEVTRVRAGTIVARNGRLLARLVEDLLDLSRASAGQFAIAPSPVEVNALVRGVVEANAAAAAEKGVQITAVLDPAVGVVSLDQERVHQVVSNLVLNALKFTRQDDRIDVRTERERDHVRIIVSDTGIGFDPSFATHLFQPFQQADASTRREHGGLGLGLSIARHLVALHGGTIEGVSGGRGCGATFTVRLPGRATAN